MNRVSLEDRSWSTSRWLAVISSLFLIQAALAWWLVDRAPIIVRSEAATFRARQLPTTADAGVSALLRLLDPTLFVLPGISSFSGRAWLEVPPLDHRPAGWFEPPRWLALQPEELLTDLERFGATNQPASTLLASAGFPLGGRPRSSADHLKPKPETRFSVTGDLSQRDLLSLPPFPTVQHQGLLPPTVIAVDVDQRGRVFQISLTGSSGSATADQQALDIVGAMVFAPAAGYSQSRNNRDFEHLRRARVMIHWWTLPPPATPASTNPPAATPSLQPLPLP